MEKEQTLKYEQNRKIYFKIEIDIGNFHVKIFWFNFARSSIEVRWLRNEGCVGKKPNLLNSILDS